MDLISILLPRDRLLLGELSVLRDGQMVLGPIECLGRSDNKTAVKHENPSRNPLKSFGDTPLGQYNGGVVYMEDSPDHRHSYGDPDQTGKIPIINLVPTGGEALESKRLGIAIHTGPLGPAGLRPTFGCVRVYQDDMNKILSLVCESKQMAVDIAEKPIG